MKTILITKINICIFIFIFSIFHLQAQNWQKTYGGLNIDEGIDVQQTSDSGFIVVGNTTSFGAGGYDIYLLKTKANGDTLWTKTFGGGLSDKGTSVQQTFDGGFIIGGSTVSFGIAGSEDIYLVKTDANGIVQWTKVIGTSVPEFGGYVIQTKDSGYCILAGQGSIGSSTTDILLIKTLPNGDTTWTKTYGQSILDLGYSVQQTIDGGFIITGGTFNVPDNHYDAYLIKTNINGDTAWTRTYNEGSHAYGFSVSQTSDSGYIVGGVANEKFYALKVDGNGFAQWNKQISKGILDRCYSIFQSSDLGYVMGGYSSISTDADVLTIKLDNQGNEIWSKKYNLNQWDEGWMIRTVINGGFIIVGNTNSPGSTGTDVLLIKTDCDNFPTANIAVMDTFCVGDSIAATLFTNLQNGLTYQWTKNDTIIPGADSTSLTIFEAGHYKLLITDSIGCDNESNKLYVDFPKPYFQIHPQEVCPGDFATMGHWNWNPDPHPFLDWDFGDGTQDTGVITTHSYQNVGTYTITHSVITSNGSCNSWSDSIIVSTTAVPPVSFDMLVNGIYRFNTIGCPGDSVEFIPYAYFDLFVPLPVFDASSYLWDFGDGTTDTIPFPVHSYANFGTYNVTFTVTNHCGNTNSASQPITIDSTITPSANFIYTDAQGIFNDTVQTCEQLYFTTQSGTSYFWDFGDGTSFVTGIDSTMHSFSSIGIYNITLITTNGCSNSDTASRVITVLGTCNGINSPLGMSSNVLVYPNPFTNSATFQISPSVKVSNPNSFDLKIFNLQGVILRQFNFDKLYFTIDREMISSGMYFYNLSSGNKNIATGKLIIQ